MKKNILIPFLLLSTLSFSQVITDGLVGYWPFSGNANDESGNGNDGTVSGAVLVADRFGIMDRAYEFNGNDAIIIADSDYLDFAENQDFSISLWINPSSIPTGANAANILDKGYNSGNIDRYLLQLRSDGKLRTFFANVIGSETENGVSIGTWFHVVFMRKNNDAFIYVDGINELVEATGSGELTNSDNLTIGARTDLGNSHFYSGLIDDIAVYNRALTESEIYLLYSGEEPIEPQLCQTIFCDDSNIGIGTPDTHGYKLAVAGNILTEEIKVATQANWPDYVFQPGYKIPSLEELEQYIQLNQKLPGIPSALEAESNGIELGEGNRLLLEKIEWLTLYIIGQQKELDQLKTDNKQMKWEIEKLKSE